MEHWIAATMGDLRDEYVSQGPTSAIAPTLVLDAAGDPIMAVGAAGAARIPGVLLQVLRQALDRQAGIEGAVAAPRVSLDRVQEKTVLHMEGLDRPETQSLVKSLEPRGIAVQPVPAGQVLARVHALMRGPDGRWTGAADPRWFGAAVAPVMLTTPAGRRADNRSSARPRNLSRLTTKAQR
jgi:gamma-glutamyltranspeptidase/glutathione hydrolase